MDSGDFHKPGLYKWKRQTEPRTNSRSQKVTNEDDIQNWIKKVEEASTRAADHVFGTNHTSGRVRGKAAVQATRDHLQEHDQAYTEAKDLLSEWMTEKVQLNDGLDFEDDDWQEQYTLQSDVKKEWDNLLANNYEEYGLPLSSRSQEKFSSRDVYDLDEDEAVASVLKGMMDKEVVQKKFSKDLGLDKYGKHKDPRNKMELRQQQVKENREKRQQELEKRRRQTQNKKEAHAQAKHLVMQEERVKQVRMRNEDMEIRKEMARIRKEMQDEKRNMEERKARETRQQDEALQAAKVKVAGEEEAELQVSLGEHKREQARRRDLLQKQQTLEARLAANSLKNLQRHFSAWYNLVLERRLQMGKALAMRDWKLMLRAWNAWKAFVRERRMDIENKRHKMEVISTQRNKHVAVNHSRSKLLRKYFIAWQIWARGEQDRRELEEAQQSTRNKMMSLLEAAATGKLGGQGQSEDGSRSNRSNFNTNVEKSSAKQQKMKSAREKQKVSDRIDAMFDQSPRPPVPPGGYVTDRSEDNSVSSHSHHKVPESCLPSEPWQVTRKHLNLSPEEIAALGDAEPGTRPDDMTSRVLKRFGKQPWMKPEVSQYEHRHANQKKVLDDQKRQIHEQKRLIEELQFKNTHTELQKQLSEQKLLLQQIAKQVPSIEQVDDTENEKTESENKGKTKPHQKPRPGSAPQKKKIPPKPETTRPESARTDATTARGSEVSAAGTNVSRPSSYTSTGSEKTKYLTVLQKMEERNAERARLKSEREEKRRKAEDARLVALRAEEEARLKEIEDEKRTRAEAYRERKRQEKQRDIERQMKEEILREQTEKAEQHYIKSILKYRGFLPFKKLVAMARERKTLAETHHKQLLMRRVFLSWYTYVREEWREREALADQMRNFLLIKQAFTSWRLYKHHMLILDHKAARHYRATTVSKVLQAWSDYVNEEKVASWEKDRISKEHYKRMLLRRTFRAWRYLPEELEKEKDRERRREELRQKVAQLLPDFEPSQSIDKSVEFRL